MSVSKIAKRKNTILYTLLKEKGIVSAEITTSHLSMSVFDVYVWRMLFNYIHYNTEFNQLRFIIPRDKSSEFFDKFEFHMKKEKEFYRMLNSLHPEPMVCDDWRKKVVFVVDPHLDTENKDWSYLEVSVIDKNNVIETRSIEAS